MPDAERESMGQKSEEKSGNRKGNEEGTQSQGRASLLQPEVESGTHSEDRNDTCLLSASERQSPVSLQGNGWGLPKWDGEVQRGYKVGPGAPPQPHKDEAEIRLP